MSDVAQRIRRLGQSYQGPSNYGDGDLMMEAASEIERLRTALREIVDRPAGDGAGMAAVAQQALDSEFIPHGGVNCTSAA